MTADHTHALGIAQNQRGEVVMTDYMHQLTTGGGKPGEGYPAVFVAPLQDGRDMEKHQNGLGVGQVGDPSYTLDQTGAQSVIAFHPTQSPINGPGSPSLGTTPGVRRLTPLECERLMAFPDDHTRWRADGTEQSDSARYRQCGNGVVANVAEWIGRHILNAMETTK